MNINSGPLGDVLFDTNTPPGRYPEYTHDRDVTSGRTLGDNHT